MLAFILRRILQSALVMLVVAFIAFGLFTYTGDPVTFMVGQDATQEQRAQLERYAFDAKSSSPEELGAYLKEQVDVWIRTARDVGIVPD